MSWRGGPGKRARARRSDQDADLDNTAWLEELEKATAAEQDDQEEEWASKLRRRRSRSPDPEPPPRGPDPPARAPELPRAPAPHDLTPYPPVGGEPAPPLPPSRPAPEPAREPDYRLLGMEPDTPRRGGDWDTGGPARDGADWGTPGPSPSAPGTAGEPGSDWPAWAPPEDRGPDLGDTDWRPVGPDAATGAWSPAEPVGREPDYPALFGELNRRKAAQREALWDSEPAPEPAEQPASPDPPAPTWPFEDTTGTWEPSDRSFIWPAEELPTTTDWEPSTPSWLDEPPAQPPAWAAAPSGTAAPGPPPAAPPPDDWAAGIHAGVPPATPAGRAGDAATRVWRPDEVVEAEPAVPLDAGGGVAPRRAAVDEIRMTEPDDHWEPYERPRSRWPRVVAVVSWIVLLMVVCWFYVFPWLERVLPENF